MVRAAWVETANCAGIAGIACLKRAYGLDLEGPGSTYVWFSVVAYNLRSSQASSQHPGARDTRPGGARRLTIRILPNKPTATTTCYHAVN